MNFFLMILLLFSTNVFSISNEIKIAESKLYSHWIYTTDITDLKSEDKKIDKPGGVTLFLFGVNFLNTNDKKTIQHCVYYRIPFKKLAGILQVFEDHNALSCEENPVGNKFISIDEIQDLSINLKNFELNLNFKKNNELVSWKFPFYNLKGKRIHEKFNSEKISSKLPGLSLGHFNDEDLNNGESHFIGKITDRFSSQSAINCLRINKNCEMVGEDLCAKCAFGFYEVVTENCPGRGNRFCGINHCGEKNEPACIRGIKTLDVENDGICSGDLRPVFNSQKNLVCQ